MNKKSTGLLLSILGVLSLVLITAGVTYAFFSYMKEGETENVISTGTITFYYDELEATGKSIKIENALPLDDATGKGLQDDYFDFKITSTITGDTSIDYEVTARKVTTGENASTLAENTVKLYLEVEDNGNTGSNKTTADGTAAGAVKVFSDLPTPATAGVPAGEKLLYTGNVPARSFNSDDNSTKSYEQNFKLRMWIDGESTSTPAADYSPYEFVLKSAVSGTTALKADTLITANPAQLITSTTYYGLSESERANYERIAYVNETTREIYTLSQAGTDGFTAGSGFVAGEQFYAINGQKFAVTVNVYANTPVVESGN